MFKKKWFVSICILVEISSVPWSAVKAQTLEPRLAFVIGNAKYRDAPLATAANDAGLIAQTLTTAGFDVTGAADLDQDSMRRAFRDFLNKVQAAGPHAITFVYLAGYGLQYSGENYFVPVDASLQRDTGIPVEAIRVSDFTRALAGLSLDGRIFVLDAARANPFPVKGNPLAGGLAYADPEAGALDAFNAAPGTIAPVEQGPYGAYARALAEMLRYGGVPIDEAFARTRLRVNELTHGAFVPWDQSKLTHPIVLLAGNSESAALPATQDYTALRSRHIRDFPDASEAYAAAVEIDTLAAYQEFLAAYPSDPLARRVRGLLAARRESITWYRTVLANTPDAYWSYMRRYPRGPHFYDARRRLGPFSVSLEPPPRFDPYDFQGLPPPPEDEYEIVDRPVLIFDGPDYPPAPPPPPDFLPPPPAEFRRMPPPQPHAPGGLPAPEAIPLPFAKPAARPGSFAQPNLSTPAGGAVPAPNVQLPSAQPGQPQGAPAHQLPGGPAGGLGTAGQPPHPGAVPPATPAAPQVQPGHALPQAVTPSAPRVEPEHMTPQARPHVEPQHAEPPHPAPQAVTPPAPHAEPPHAEPLHAPPQAAPAHVTPPPAPHVEPQHAEPPHPAPQAVAPPAPHVEPPHQEPPHPAPQAVPHAEPPKPPAASAPQPAHPAAAPKPGEKKPEEKPGEQH